jgi:adenylate cyclase
VPIDRKEAERLAAKMVRGKFEALAKQLGKTVLMSRASAGFVESDFDLERVGEYPVRDFSDPIELFAYHA